MRGDTLAEYKTKEQKIRFYTGSKWQKIRRLALERDNHECQRCAKLGRVHVDSIKKEGERKSIELNVHHIKELEDYPELAYELDNVTTLCLDCHNHIHDRFKAKPNKWAADERW